MPKRKNFNRRALSCTSTRAHLKGRRSVELMNLFFKPVRASRAQGFQGPYEGSQLVLTFYRIYIFCFQMCKHLPELMKNGGAGIFPVYYSLKSFIRFVLERNVILLCWCRVSLSLMILLCLSKSDLSSLTSLVPKPFFALSHRMNYQDPSFLTVNSLFHCIYYEGLLN